MVCINPIGAQNNNCVHKKTNFKGITTTIPHYFVRCSSDWQDNIRALSHAKYYEALDDNIHWQNKHIRQDNFHFLDVVQDSARQWDFISWFKAHTGFPNLKKVTQNIVNEFISKSEKAASDTNTRVEGLGFDSTSSIGLKHALPGSDIDKAYVIIDDSGSYSPKVPYFKGSLWENVDQFLMSLNHRDTFPEVYTKRGVKSTLERIDDVVRRKMDLSSSKTQQYRNNIAVGLVPRIAGEFNIELARHLPDNGLSKEEVKNFAYFLESVRDGVCAKSSSYMENELRPMLKESPFANFSNVTQMKAHDILLSSGQKQIKTKLRNREILETEFDRFDLDTQYRFVVDMVKNISEDQSERFSRFYRNDDDIKERYDALNRLLV